LDRICPDDGCAFKIFVVKVVKKFVTVYSRHFLVTCETSAMKVLRINKYDTVAIYCHVKMLSVGEV